MTGELDGKVAVITGAGSGMARASVEIFVREGAQVVAADVTGAEQDTATAVGNGVVPVHCDVTNEADVEALMRAAVDEFGRVDSMLNVAGVADAMMLADVTMEHYDKVMDVDLRGVLLGTKHAIRAMLESGRGGTIVNWSSLGGSQRLVLHRCVLGGQGGGDRGHEGGCRRVRGQGHPRQLPLPGVHLHRDERRRREHPGDAREGGVRTAAARRTRSRRSRRSSRPIGPRTSAAPSSPSTAAGPPSSPEPGHRTDEARPVRVPRPRDHRRRGGAAGRAR